MNEIPVKQHHKMKARHPQLLDAVDARTWADDVLEAFSQQDSDGFS